jgi:uncharacterized membrane protein YccC
MHKLRFSSLLGFFSSNKSKIISGLKYLALTLLTSLFVINFTEFKDATAQLSSASVFFIACFIACLALIFVLELMGADKKTEAFSLILFSIGLMFYIGYRVENQGWANLLGVVCVFVGFCSVYLQMKQLQEEPLQKVVERQVQPTRNLAVKHRHVYGQSKETKTLNPNFPLPGMHLSPH